MLAMNKLEGSRFSLAILYPLLAVVCVAAVAVTLGVIFTMLYHTALHEWGVIIAGMALVVLVPAVAALVERRMDRA